jgi:hypothetical protein
VQALPKPTLGSFGITIPTGQVTIVDYAVASDAGSHAGAVLGATPIVSTLIPF